MATENTTDHPSGAAYVVAHIAVRDEAKWAEYRGKVGATVAAWGGELMMRGTRKAVLYGEHPYTDVVLLRFPDAQAASDWHDSPDYQALVGLRTEAADAVLVSYES